MKNRALQVGLVVAFGLVATSCSSERLPVYEVSWDGTLNGQKVGAPLTAFVWGSPVQGGEMDVEPKAYLIPRVLLLQEVQVAIESYGCFFQNREPSQKQLYYVEKFSVRDTLNYWKRDTIIPIEVEVKRVDGRTSRQLEKMRHVFESTKGIRPEIIKANFMRCVPVADQDLLFQQQRQK